MEGREVRMDEKNQSIAAFFDLDGTMIPLPSLEQRFFRMLRYRKAIPAENYLLWLKEAVRLLPRGVKAIMHSNKMYLKGVQILDESERRNGSDSPGHRSDSQGEGQAPASSSKRTLRNSRWPAPAFFQAAIQRVAWHARQGHAIVIVSGTLEPLAKAAARALEAELASRGFAVRIRVRATQLEEGLGRWTGRIAGEAMFREAKARAVKRLAQEIYLDLAQCWAYGDSMNDQWMLADIGKPVAVNPSRQLARIARKRGWPVLCWNQARSQTQRHREHREKEGQEQPREIQERSLQAVRWI
jgi:HAD superfamily phosphoserine phosphatase-like hydrolase